MSRHRHTLHASVMFAVVAMALCPAVGPAGFVIGQGSIATTQSVNFTPANSGTTVVGDTNPAPVYPVFVDSLQGQTLHASGSTVDTGVGGPGFNSIDLRPDTAFAWRGIEFTLDSFNNIPLNSTNITITAFDDLNGDSSSATLTFPWEGNNGDNQHYFATADGVVDVITRLVLSYSDPNGNTIQDIHNIDVNSVSVVPEPSSILLSGTAIGCLIGFRSRFRARRRMAT